MRDENGNWLEPDFGKDLSDDSGRHFKKEPAINVISKEELEDRTRKVFHLLWETLARSFGPYGAPTIICNYPYRHVTKDGYTIMKSLSMDASETLTDQAIADMASDICGRLNYSVGDGTTSAIIATNSIYQNYQKYKDRLDAMNLLPRDIIHEFNKIKIEAIEKLDKKVRVIRSDDLDDLADNIKDVVYISSNGDEELTNNITELYRKLGTPAITCKLADDGIAKCQVIDGYQYELTLTDRLYINDDDGTMKLKDADVIIFSIKVTEEIYDKILKPLDHECKLRKRHLIVAAPKFDEAAIINKIKKDLNDEKRKTGDINMVLCTYKAISAHTRKLIEDYAVLTDTTVIDRIIVDDILNKVSAGNHICKVINIDSREIDGIETLAINSSNNTAQTYTYGTDEYEKIQKEGYTNVNECENGALMDGFIRLGFVHNASIGMNVSIFSGFEYDEAHYKAVLMDAEDDLKGKQDKYKKLGTFNLEVSLAQQRLYSLRLKMGMIEIGADSELSQKLLKDAADDAIRAAASAYQYGVVLGCNVNLIQCLEEIKEESKDDDVRSILTGILCDGFKDVYRTVMNNAFDDEVVLTGQSPDNKYNYNGFAEILKKKGLLKNSIGFSSMDNDRLNELNTKFKFDVPTLIGGSNISIYNGIIEISLLTDTVYDVSNKEFNTDVINSAQTDREILTATIDLIGLLITGNQMIVTQRNSF